MPQAAWGGSVPFASAECDRSAVSVKPGQSELRGVASSAQLWRNSSVTSRHVSSHSIKAFNCRTRPSYLYNDRSL
eukprot:6207559-Pleurochrysis_carterae.AAC.1